MHGNTIPAWGARGRRFKSSRSDQSNRRVENLAARTPSVQGTARGTSDSGEPLKFHLVEAVVGGAAFVLSIIAAVSCTPANPPCQHSPSFFLVGTVFDCDSSSDASSSAARSTVSNVHSKPPTTNGE